MSVDLFFRPLDRSTWVDDGRKKYKPDRWKRPYGAIVRELEYELSRLGVARAVVEIDYAEADLRRDGMPRANTTPHSPKVRLSFTTDDLGPQCFMCDTFAEWKVNLHGIMLTLQRLRLIEEYGATRGKQQYRGWAALPAKAWDGWQSAAEARAFLARMAGHEDLNGMSDDELYREAARRHHPDKGGDPQMMTKINAARRLLHV